MPKQKRKHGWRAAEKLSALTSLPMESFCDMPILLCRGDRELQVEGCSAIGEYSRTCIRLYMGNFALVVIGTELSLSTFRGKALIIRGTIQELRWEV